MTHSESSDQGPPPGDSFASVLGRNWSERLENDDAEVDLELLAAFAEGRLNEQEREVVEELIANSPAALETLLFFHRALNVGQGESPRQIESDGNANTSSLTTGSETPRPQTDTPLKYTPANRSGLFSSRPHLASAAALLMAIGAGILATVFIQKSQHLSHENLRLIASLDEQTRLLALARKEQVFESAAGTFRSFASGTMTPRMLELTVMESGPIARGGTDDEEAVRYREAIARQASQTVEQVDQKTGWDVSLEQASVALAAGNLNSAGEILSRIVTEGGDENAEVQNLKALIVLARVDSGEATLDEAAETLENLTTAYPDFAQGWLNLAIFRFRVQGLDASLSAWNEYLKKETSAELRSTSEELIQRLRRRES